MNRLAAAIRLDLRLQRRYGFYYATGAVALVYAALLRSLPDSILDEAVPLVVFSELATVGFSFIAGMVLFEKAEGTLSALVVTPLRFREYLAAKLTTLTMLAMLVSLVVVLVGYGPGFNPLILMLGVVLTSTVSLLTGFIVVSPFRSISSFLVPSAGPMVLLNLPVIHYLGWSDSPAYYLLPTQGALLLLAAAFGSVEAWQVVYGVVYQSAWIGLLAWLSLRAFDRYVVVRRGAR